MARLGRHYPLILDGSTHHPSAPKTRRAPVTSRAARAWSHGAKTRADNAVLDLAPIQSAPVFGLWCNEFTITGNPLDANSVDTVIPAICDQTVVVVADANGCAQLRNCGPID